MRTVFAIAVLGLLVIAATPPALAASHGIAWTATGVAVAPDGSAATITVHFNGSNPFVCAPGYVVTLRDAAGALLEQRSFSGFQTQNQLPSSEQFQETFVSLGSSTAPAVAFTWSGVQHSDVNFSVIHQFSQAIQGKYQGWTFAAATVAQPINGGAC